MTVTKYRTFEEAERALWEFNPDDDYFRKVAAMFELMGKIQPKPAFRKGLFKYRSIEEADRDKLPEGDVLK
jgi:hypothetical protein